MFSKKKISDSEVAKVRSAKEPIAAIISKEMSITGEINFQGKARIDGKVEGNITGEYLVVSESSRIQGDLILETLICHGTIEGNVQAKVVTALSSSTIIGKLAAGNLTVESGAHLEGEIASSEQNNGNRAKEDEISIQTASLKRSNATLNGKRKEEKQK